MNLGAKISNYLKQAGITKTELSVLTGIPLSKISMALSGKRRLSLEEFSNICYVLNKAPNDFITPEAPAFLKQNALAT